MFAFAEQGAEKSPSLSVLLLQAASDSHRPDVWQQSKVRDALEILLHWLDTDGAHGVHVLDDLSWAAVALVWSGRAAEAVPLFRRLGPHSGGPPWQIMGPGPFVFNGFRTKACKTAGTWFRVTPSRDAYSLSAITPPNYGTAAPAPDAGLRNQPFHTFVQNPDLAPDQRGRTETLRLRIFNIAGRLVVTSRQQRLSERSRLVPREGGAGEVIRSSSG